MDVGMDLIFKLLFGLGIGALGTLVGTGGGWAMVPLFLLVMDFTPQNAVATSLFVVSLNALSGTAAYIHQKRVHMTMAVVFAAATVPGAVLGSYLVQLFNRRSFGVAFGVFLLLLSASMALGKAWMGRHAQDVDHAYQPTGRQMWLGAAVSALVGVISSILGVGGGIIHVPFLILALGLPVHMATATSHFVLAVTSLTGVVVFAARHQVVWSTALPMGLGAVVGAQLGARLSAVLPGRIIQIILSVLLFIFALTLIADLR